MIARGGAILLVCAFGACKAGPLGRTADAGAEIADAGLPSREPAALVVDASSPPDDTVLPSTSDELVGRAGHLLEAISRDDATLANDILFPRDGWLLTREALDPGKDWESHVATPFRKGVHSLWRQHHAIDHAQVVSLVLGGAIRQTTPRKHGWKKPLWTASDSRLTFVANGRTRVVTIHEMVAWRGAWYVTRL
ncbi:MAG: hypothetical protein WBY94_08475 [Polyangiaceae bacterium]